ncbi:hypothetical protein Plhal304r1_c002g0006891 [Plasmopara halstedii]
MVRVSKKLDGMRSRAANILKRYNFSIIVVFRVYICCDRIKQYLVVVPRLYL